MPRPSRIDKQRVELLPIVAKTFSELGYHRTTTAELARRCNVRENILYRLWRDKNSMFIASIEHVYDLAEQTWSRVATKRSGAFSIADVLEYEAEHLGEFGHYRIIFSGLSETEDPEIRQALARMYKKFHRFIRQHLEASREGDKRSGSLDAGVVAWALIGLGTVSTIGREMDIMTARARKRVLQEVGGRLASLQ